MLSSYFTSSSSLPTELNEIASDPLNLPKDYTPTQPQWLSEQNYSDPADENIEESYVNFFLVRKKDNYILNILNESAAFSDILIVKPSRFMDYCSTDKLPENVTITLKLVKYNDNKNKCVTISSIDLTNKLHLFTKDAPFMSLFFYSKDALNVAEEDSDDDCLCIPFSSITNVCYLTPELHIENNNDHCVNLRYSFTKLKFNKETREKVFQNISSFTTDLLDYNKLINYDDILYQETAAKENEQKQTTQLIKNLENALENANKLHSTEQLKNEIKILESILFRHTKRISS